jgi:RND superfamily putative drug exporter
MFIAATVVRLAVVPATMELLGKWNWSFPRWLDRLVPRLDFEGGHAPEQGAVPAFGETDYPTLRGNDRQAEG